MYQYRRALFVYYHIYYHIYIYYLLYSLLFISCSTPMNNELWVILIVLRYILE